MIVASCSRLSALWHAAMAVPYRLHGCAEAWMIRPYVRLCCVRFFFLILTLMVAFQPCTSSGGVANGVFEVTSGNEDAR